MLYFYLFIIIIILMEFVYLKKEDTFYFKFIQKCDDNDELCKENRKKNLDKPVLDITNPDHQKTIDSILKF